MRRSISMPITIMTASHFRMVIPMPGPCAAGGFLAARRDEDARVVVFAGALGAGFLAVERAAPDPLEERALVLVFRAGEVVRDAMVATLTDIGPDADDIAGEVANHVAAWHPIGQIHGLLWRICCHLPSTSHLPQMGCCVL